MDDFVQQEVSQEKIREYHSRFQQNSADYITRPTSKRQCTDVCCLIFFIICFLAFVVYSFTSISDMATLSQFQIPADKTVGTFLEGINIQQLTTFASIIFGCFGIAVVISLVLCGLIWKIADIAVYTMAGLGFVGLLAAAIFLVLVFGEILQDFSAYFFVVAFIYLFFVIALREYLVKCAILMKTVAKFIFQNPKILILVILALLYCLIVITLWALGLYSFCISYANQSLTYGGFTVSAIFWGFLLVFFNYYFYYTSVFLTSYSLTIWFYQKEDSDIIGTPLKHMARYHLGTITFASLLVSFVQMIKFFLVFARWHKCQGIFGYIGSCCSFLLCFCTGSLETLFQVLNSYAITLTALTGESFVQAAHTVGHLAYDDYQAFSAFSYSGHVIRFGALVACSSIPTIVGAILVAYNLTNAYLQIVGILLIMFCTSIIGMVILQIFIQSIHTLFIIYRLDTELQEAGHEITWIDEYGMQLNKSFDEAFVGQIKKKPKPKYRKITTIVVHQNGYTQVYKNRVQIQPQEVSQDKL